MLNMYDMYDMLKVALRPHSAKKIVAYFPAYFNE